ncbi:MAG: KpsF/GutQ family sugar-phosphate isomerase [Alphaproteobacteria bacterium]|nr:KpsF/GutQ family sugar-phosphate isomerase [Alphaproteobacteria bacterium]
MPRLKPVPSAHKVEDIAAGRHTLALEIEGLQALSDTLGESFSQAVELLLACKGRVILGGMGKSGHVGRKIAATFASTGTPAFFVHPGEASHGDLGMITKDDVVILLSNSGETAELKDVIVYCNRFAIPLIAVVRRKTSALVDAADIAMILPEIPEASPVNAPTTSTTMMMALGDALAMALLARRGFGPEEFGVLHPGGKLGKAFVHVRDLMHRGADLPVVRPAQLMKDVLLVITAKRFGCAAVVDDQNRCLGVITDGDLRRHMADDILNRPASEVMTKNPVTIQPNILAAEALGIMNEKAITALFVLEDGKAVGILHIHDILRAGIA